MMSSRLDIILLGATGYTGRICAEYIVRRLPLSVTWAIAGRSQSKLEQLAEDLRLEEFHGPQPCEIITLDVSSESEVVDLIKRTRVLICVVGPYAEWGTLAFQACAENGTHYLDCNGETPWLKEMIEKYHDTAEQSKAIMIPSCGIGAVPADLSTKLLVEHIYLNLHARTADVITAIHDVSATPSGGTINSVCHTLSAGLPALLDACAPYALSPHKPAVQDPKTTRSSSLNAFGVQKIQELGTLIISPQEDHDRAVVHRSWGLHGPDGYGQHFSFSARMRMSGPISGWWWRTKYILKVLVLMVPVFRWVVTKRMYPSGTGLSTTRRDRNFFEYRTLGVADKESRMKAMVTMSYPGDPYNFTGLALAEAAIVLLTGDTEAHRRGGGVLTPALLGKTFADRLMTAGVQIDVTTL